MLKKRKNNGFTMVETMVVAALFGVLALVLFSSFAMGLRVWKRSASYNVAERKAVLGLERLGIELRQALNDPSVGFWGEKGHIEFANLGAAGLVNISYDHSPQDGVVRRFVLSRRQMRGEEPPALARVVIPGAQEFNMTFYGPDAQTGNFSFFESWNYTASGIPQAVKVSVGFADGKNLEKIILIPIAQ